jgi:hypothetical protein
MMTSVQTLQVQPTKSKQPIVFLVLLPQDKKDEEVVAVALSSSPGLGIPDVSGDAGNDWVSTLAHLGFLCGLSIGQSMYRY